MTINSPAAIHLGHVPRARPRSRACRRTNCAGRCRTDILKEYIAQKEYIFPPEPSMRSRDGHDRVRRGARCRSGIRFDLGLPHPRSRLDRGAGTGLHPRRRASRTSTGRSSAGLTWTTLRPASPSSSTPTSTSSKRSPSTAPRGASGPRELRDRFGATEPALVADALPHPDGGRLADRAAAGEQHRPHRAPGPRRGAGRDAVSAHRTPSTRRWRCRPRPPSASRSAPTGDRPRDRRRQHDRSARRSGYFVEIT